MNNIGFSIGDIIKSDSINTSYYLVCSVGDNGYDVLSLKTQSYYILSFIASTKYQIVSSV